MREWRSTRRDGQSISAIRSYGADPGRTKIVPLAANIDCDRTEAEIERLIGARSTDEVNLLFLGIDWLRKGGDLAVAVASELSRRGNPDNPERGRVRTAWQ